MPALPAPLPTEKLRDAVDLIVVPAVGKGEPSTDIMGRQSDPQADNVRHATIVAEAALHDGRPYDVVQALRDVDISSASYARKLMIDALVLQRDWPSLAVVLKNPSTVEEIVTLVSALVEINNFDDAQARLDAATEVDAATRSALQGRLEAKKNDEVVMSGDLIPFRIDSQRVVQLLAKQIYQSPLSLLRENTQNAFDAVRQRLVRQSSFNPSIEITLTPEKVVIADNGIGMTPE